MSSFAQAKTIVLWDMEECKIPYDLDTQTVCQNIISALAKEGYCGNVSIKGYGKKNKIGDDLLPEGFTFIHEREIARRDHKIFEEALFGTLNGPCNLMLIAHDYALTMLDGLDDVNILLAQNVVKPTVVRKLINASSVWLWKSLSSGGSPTPIDLSASAHVTKLKTFK